MKFRKWTPSLQLKVELIVWHLIYKGGHRCNHDFAFAIAAAKSLKLDPRLITESLEMGGCYCDCEVVNVLERKT